MQSFNYPDTIVYRVLIILIQLHTEFNYLNTIVYRVLIILIQLHTEF